MTTKNDPVTEIQVHDLDTSIEIADNDPQGGDVYLKCLHLQMIVIPLTLMRWNDQMIVSAPMVSNLEYAR